METAVVLLQKMTVIYFNEPHKNIYADLPPCKEQAKRLSRRIFRNAMTALATERQNQNLLLDTIYNAIST